LDHPYGKNWEKKKRDNSQRKGSKEKRRCVFRYSLEKRSGDRNRRKPRIEMGRKGGWLL